MSREVTTKFENIEQLEGAGVKIRRSIGSRQLRNFDPFLLLDEFKNHGNVPGFPDHPHRGFETVSYILAGNIIHEDFNGHKGIIGPGDLQWMTAGRGIMHSEMPYINEPNGLIWGLQLWVNLPKKYKMVEPAYQELKDKDIPRVSKNGITVKIISGESMGVKSSVYTRTPTMYLDFKVDKGASFTQEIPNDWNSFIFVLDGTGKFGTQNKLTESGPHHTLVLSKGDSVYFKNEQSTQLHFVLIAGEPINEPVVQSGPFVMNTAIEINQAFHDFQNGKNGFEKAVNWRSENGNK